MFFPAGISDFFLHEKKIAKYHNKTFSLKHRESQAIMIFDYKYTLEVQINEKDVTTGNKRKIEEQ